MKKPWRNFLIIPLMTIFILVFVTWLLTPLIAKHYFSKYFASQGETASIASLSIDFFPPKVVIKDLKVLDKQQETLTLKKATLGIRAFPLFTKTIHVSDADIDGLYLAVSQKKSDWIIAGINLAQYQTNEKTEADAQAQDETKQTPFSWSVALPKATLKDVQVDLTRQPSEQDAIQKDTFKIVNFSLKNLSGTGLKWQGDLALNSQVNQSTINLNSHFDYSPEQASATLNLAKNTLSINDFSHFIPAPWNQGKGNITLNGALTASMKVKENVSYFDLNDAKLSVIAQDIDLPIQTNASVTSQKTALTLSDIVASYNTQKALKADATIALDSQDTNLTQQNDSASFHALTIDSNLSIDRHGTTNDIQNKTTSISLNKAALTQGENQASLEQFDLDMANTKASFNDDIQTISLQSDVKLTTKGLDAQLPKEQKASLGNGSLSLPFTLTKNGNAITADITKTDLSLNKLSLALSSIILDNTSTDVQLANVKLNQTDSEHLTLTADNSIKSTELAAQQADIKAQYQSLTWSNNFSVSKENQKLAITSKTPQLSLEKIVADQKDKVSSTLGLASVKGDQVQVSIDGDQAPALSGQNINLTTQSLDAKLAPNKRAASWKDADVTGVNFTTKGSQFDTHTQSVTLNNLLVSEPLNDKKKTPALATVGKIHIDTIQATQDGASVDKIQIQKLMGNLLLNKQRQVENLVFVNKEAQTPSQAKTSTVPKAEDADKAISQTPSAKQQPAFKAPYYVILKSFEVTGNSQIFVQDNGVSPALNRTLDITKLSLKNLNTKDKSQAMTVALGVKNGKYSTLDGQLKLYPLADKLTMQSELKLSQAELPPYSPYIASVLGYQIDSGQLDLDLKLDADKGNLKGISHINLKQFDLGGSYESSTAIKSGVVPLNIAVSALKDSNDNINLDIPLSGDINSPEFGWSDFLFLPVKKALFKASSTYLLQTFVPYANVISIAQIAGEQLLKIRVQPLIYEAEQTSISDQQDVFLKQLVNLLKNKESSDLKVCGIASYSDLGLEKAPAKIDDKERQKANTIAEERAQNLKDYLVSHDVKSSRLFICAPQVDLTAKSQPRVELNF